MSEPQTLDLTEPVEQNVEEVVEEVPTTETAAVEESSESVEEPVEAPVEAPVEEPVEEPVEAPAEEPAEEPVEEPVEEPAEEPAEEVEVEEPVEEPSEAPPIEQVASEIRSILTEVSTVESVPEVEVSEGNTISLKTLIDVLSKWSGSKIHRRKVETLLKEGTEVDENLDNIEKVIELFKSWANKTNDFKTDNLFTKIDEYTLKNEINLKGERTKVLSELIDLTINCSKRKYNVNQIIEILENL